MKTKVSKQKNSLRRSDLINNIDFAILAEAQCAAFMLASDEYTSEEAEK